jgi:hypothetical protein
MTASQVLQLSGPVAGIADRNPELFLARGFDDGRPPSAFETDPKVLRSKPPFKV